MTRICHANAIFTKPTYLKFLRCSCFRVAVREKNGIMWENSQTGGGLTPNLLVDVYLPSYFKGFYTKLFLACQNNSVTIPDLCFKLNGFTLR